MKKSSIFISIICMACGFSACSDFFDQESDHVIYSENHKLDNATDSAYTMVGILNKLQTIADRTILLGEVRGDLVDLTSSSNNDLRELARFNVSDGNMYNAPRDYYAVINSCNYLIANADTTLKDNRNNYVFMKEYAAAKSIRAWTYLQLVLNYGKVPFVTTPILTKEQSEANYDQYDIQAVCEYFINDLLPLAEKYGREYPWYDNNVLYRLIWFPLNIVLGDLYLWAGSVSGNKEYYKQAALRYYKYISERNGENIAYPTSTSCLYWDSRSTTWNYPGGSWDTDIARENYERDSELITLIPSNTNKADGNYSELYDLFNSNEENDYKVSICPSVRMQEISEAQDYCLVSTNGKTVTYAPKGLSQHRSGDLRLSGTWWESYGTNHLTNERIEMQRIYKFTSSHHVHIYRRQMVYLRMAEALNQAGYPRLAFQFLSRGVNNDVISEEVYPYYSQTDSVFISQFNFPSARYVEQDVENFNHTGGGRNNTNTMGMHSRGSGFTPMNEYYRLPIDTLRSEADQTPDLQKYVEELILTEGALEFAFEGIRYYDIMRFALRSSNPGEYLSKRIYMRRGAEKSDAMKGEIADLNDTKNWYLRWNGKIGL